MDSYKLWLRNDPYHFFFLIYQPKLVNGSNQQKVTKKCKSSKCPESREWRVFGEQYYDYHVATQLLIMTELELIALTKIFPYRCWWGWAPAGDNESKAETQDLRADEFHLHPLHFLTFSEIFFFSCKVMLSNISCHQWLILSFYFSAHPSPTIQLLSQPSATLVWPVGSSPFSDHRTTQESPVAESCDIKQKTPLSPRSKIHFSAAKVQRSCQSYSDS